MLDEMAETVGKEFDFEREARLMETVRQRLEVSNTDVKIPKPIQPLTSTRLLVMKRMQGKSYDRDTILLNYL